MIKDLIKRNRTYRKFYEDFVIQRKTLEELVDLARLSASAANRQSLRYILSHQKSKNELMKANDYFQNKNMVKPISLLWRLISWQKMLRKLLWEKNLCSMMKLWL